MCTQIAADIYNIQKEISHIQYNTTKMSKLQIKLKQIQTTSKTFEAFGKIDQNIRQLDQIELPGTGCIEKILFCLYDTNYVKITEYSESILSHLHNSSELDKQVFLYCILI